MLSGIGKKVLTRLARANSARPNRGYHQIIVDHYENPRNVGSLDKSKINVGTGELYLVNACFTRNDELSVGLVGAPACGDVMKLQVEVDDNGVVTSAKFKTYGCGSAIASSSVATEWLIGKKIEECLSITVSFLDFVFPYFYCYSFCWIECGHCQSLKASSCEKALLHAR